MMIRRLAFVLVMGCAWLAIVCGCRGERAISSLDSGGQAYLAQCAVCHGTTGQGDGPLVATIVGSQGTPPPALDTERIAALGRKGLRRAIGSDAHLRPGSNMPAWGPHLGSEWTDRVADFLLSIPDADDADRARLSRYLASPAETPSNARSTYVLYCSGCHGAWGEGDGFFSASSGEAIRPASLRSKALGELDDAELLEVLGLGGAHAPEAATMPGWLHTLSLEDRQALAIYLRSFTGPIKESK